MQPHEQQGSTGGYPQQYSQPQQPQQYGQQPYPQQPHPQQPHPQQHWGAPPYGAYPQPSPNNGLGVAGFVCGLLGLIFCWVPVFGIILGILGVILGGVGMSSGNKRGAGNGMAISGLVLGTISLIPAIIILVAISNT